MRAYAEKCDQSHRFIFFVEQHDVVLYMNIPHVLQVAVKSVIFVFCGNILAAL